MKVLSMILVCCFFAFGCVEEQFSGSEDAETCFNCPDVYKSLLLRVSDSECSDEIFEDYFEYTDPLITTVEMCEQGDCVGSERTGVLHALSIADREVFCEKAAQAISGYERCADLSSN